jgi:hypothetical protein
MWQRRLSHLPIRQHKPGLQEQATPYHAHCRQDSQMFEAQPNRGGTDREDTEQHQAVDATHTALQGIWYNGEAIAAHQHSADRVEDGDAREDGSEQEGRRDDAEERSEQYEHDKCAAQRWKGGQSAVPSKFPMPPAAIMRP